MSDPRQTVLIEEVMSLRTRLLAQAAVTERMRGEIEYAWKEFDNHWGTLYGQEKTRREKARESFHRMKAAMDIPLTPSESEVGAMEKVVADARELRKAQSRMSDDWAEAANDAPKRRELLGNLNIAGNALFESLSSLDAVRREAA